MTDLKLGDLVKITKIENRPLCPSTSIEEGDWWIGNLCVDVKKDDVVLLGRIKNNHSEGLNPGVFRTTPIKHLEWIVPLGAFVAFTHNTKYFIEKLKPDVWTRDLIGSIRPCKGSENRLLQALQLALSGVTFNETEPKPNAV